MFNAAQWSGNVKKGAKLKLTDFEPRYRSAKSKSTNPKFAEERLKAQLNSLARNNPKD
jgi:hypothetical protein